MSQRRKAPADAPSTLKDPDCRKRARTESEALQRRYRDLCGPVITTPIKTDKEVRS